MWVHFSTHWNSLPILSYILLCFIIFIFFAIFLNPCAFILVRGIFLVAGVQYQTQTTMPSSGPEEIPSLILLESFLYKSGVRPTSLLISSFLQGPWTEGPTIQYTSSSTYPCFLLCPPCSVGIPDRASKIFCFRQTEISNF